MSSILWYLGVYLVIGAGVIVLLNALTNGRIFRNFQESAYESQDVLLSHGAYVGTEAIKYVMVIVVWVFWPALVYGAVEKRLKKEKENQK